MPRSVDLPSGQKASSPAAPVTSATGLRPIVGEQYLVLSPGGDMAAGLVLVGPCSDALPPHGAEPHIGRTTSPDRAVLDYDHAGHALKAIHGCTLELSSSANSRSWESSLLALPRSESRPWTGRVRMTATWCSAGFPPTDNSRYFLASSNWPIF